MKIDYEIVRVADAPKIKEKAAGWFHEKWNVPLEAYLESMDECIAKKNGVPSWYVAKHGDKIIGGLGVIENDFHDRVDLTPNVCAVYVEKDARNNGIAGALLEFVCRDMAAVGIKTLYLVTDHVGFYERYGWKFLCEVTCNGEDKPSRMYVHNVP